MKIGLISSGLKDLGPRFEIGYETHWIQKSAKSRGHTCFLIDPSKTTFGSRSTGSFAFFRDESGSKISVNELDVLLIRRTAGMIDEVVDFAKFASKANPNLYVVDPIDSLGRPTSKTEAICRRSGEFPQPHTQIINNLLDLEEDFEFPLISKPMYGTSGKGVRRCNNESELSEQLESNYESYSGYATIVQKDITGQNEFRVVVINGVSQGCVSKPAPDAGIARNVEKTGEWEPYEGPNKIKIEKFAQKISLFTGHFMSGVDIIEKDGELFIIECNRNPQFGGFDFATGTRISNSLIIELENELGKQPNTHPVQREVIDNSSVRKPSVFIGSSSEGHDIALAAQWHLESLDSAEATVWSQGVFEPSDTTFHSLNEAASYYDYAIFVLTADDKATYRELSVLTARDNVIFEAGLFIGSIGAKNVFFLVSSETYKKIKVPTDLSGVNLVTWNPRSGTKNLRPALGKAMTEIRHAMGL